MFILPGISVPEVFLLGIAVNEFAYPELHNLDFGTLSLCIRNFRTHNFGVLRPGVFLPGISVFILPEVFVPGISVFIITCLKFSYLKFRYSEFSHLELVHSGFVSPEF